MDNVCTTILLHSGEQEIHLWSDFFFSPPQARNYISSLPNMPKRNFADVFIGANPLGKKKIKINRKNVLLTVIVVPKTLGFCKSMDALFLIKTVECDMLPACVMYLLSFISFAPPSCGPSWKNAGPGHGQENNSSGGPRPHLLFSVPRPRGRAGGRAVRPELREPRAGDWRVETYVDILAVRCLLEEDKTKAQV